MQVPVYVRRLSDPLVLGFQKSYESPNIGDSNQMQTSGRSESKHTLSQIYSPLAIFNNTSQKSVRQSLKTNTHRHTHVSM